MRPVDGIAMPFILMLYRRKVSWLALSVLFSTLIGCGDSSSSTSSTDTGLEGKVQIDGSSTVAPITTATAELFAEAQPKIQVTVGISGTGGGFKKFLDESPDLRTDINDASRPIKSVEIEKAASLGIEFIELPIAVDGIAVMVHPENDFCTDLTVEELKRIWEPGSEITNWRQVRQTFPDLPLKLYGPGPDSGTFDYFTEAIVGKSKASRNDYTASENDNVLVQGIAGDRGSLGYFGFSYYEAYKDNLKLVAVDGGDGKPVKPSLDIIRAGNYRPLSRPLFLYVNKQASTRSDVAAFLSFFFDRAREIVEHPKVNYVALPDSFYQACRTRLATGVTGTAFNGTDEGTALTLAERYSIQ